MSKLGTWQEAIKDAIEADTAKLPEFGVGSVVLTSAPDFKDIDGSIDTACRKAEGLALVIFDRSGDNPAPQDGLQMNIELKMQLFISPILRDLSVDNTLRAADEILVSLMKFLHGSLLDTLRGHCIDETRVKGFRELPDEEYVVFEITIIRTIEF